MCCSLHSFFYSVAALGNRSSWGCRIESPGSVAVFVALIGSYCLTGGARQAATCKKSRWNQPLVVIRIGKQEIFRMIDLHKMVKRKRWEIIYMGWKDSLALSFRLSRVRTRSAACECRGVDCKNGLVETCLNTSKCEYRLSTNEYGGSRRERTTRMPRSRKPCNTPSARQWAQLRLAISKSAISLFLCPSYSLFTTHCTPQKGKDWAGNLNSVWLIGLQ